jgi:hypothetical protein
MNGIPSSVYLKHSSHLAGDRGDGLRIPKIEPVKKVPRYALIRLNARDIECIIIYLEISRRFWQYQPSINHSMHGLNMFSTP